MSKYTDWQDYGGFFHVQKYPTRNGSENSPLFTAEVALFAKLNGFEIVRPVVKNLKVSEVDFRDRMDAKIPCHFSHDNMTGLYCLRELGYFSGSLPIIRWNSTKQGKYSRKFWLHPRDVLFFLALSHPIFSALSLLLLPIALVSFLRPREETSGKCLFFTRFGTMSLSKNYILRTVGKIGLAIGEKVMVKQYGEHPYIGMFDYYFKNEGHPCRVEIRKLYGVSQCS